MNREKEGNDIPDQGPEFEKLTEAQQYVLRRSMGYLFDAYMDDLARLMDGGTGFDKTLMASALPPRFTHVYDIPFAKKFFLSFVAGTEHIRNSEHPRSVAEEMAMKEIFEHAVSMVEDEECAGEEEIKNVIEGLSDFEEELFEDQDFLFLWDGRFDGIEYDENLGAVNLEVSKWFKAFRPDRPVNPLLEELR